MSTVALHPCVAINTTIAIMIEVFLLIVQERARSPIAVKLAKKLVATENKHAVHMYWMQARDIPKYEPPFQKVC
jgi:hypothetical protein